jgi:hypothetical protein
MYLFTKFNTPSGSLVIAIKPKNKILRMAVILLQYILHIIFFTVVIVFFQDAKVS